MATKQKQILRAYGIPWSQTRYFRASAAVSQYDIVAPNTTASTAAVPNAAPATNAGPTGRGTLFVAVTAAPNIGDFFLAAPWVYRTGMDTSSYSANSMLYLNTTGGVTTTKPSGATVRRRRVGQVLVSHATTGTVLYDPNSIAHVGLHADLRLEPATELTIAAGAITVSQGSHTVDTEADAATDNLDTITGVAAEEILLLRPANAARTVVLRHGQDNIICPDGVNIPLVETTDFVLIVGDGTNAVVVATSTLASEEVGTLDFTARTELTIAAGAIAVTQSHHDVDTETDAASDNLDSITGSVDGGVYILAAENAARSVVIRDFSVSTGNIYTPGQQPITLAEADDYAILFSDGTNLTVVAFRTQSLSGGGLGAALASVVNGLGASLVAVEDTGTNLTAVNVEAAFAEILDTGYAWRDQIFATATELTIAAGVIVCTQAYHDIDTEADAASDNLDTINGVVDGELVILRAENAARSVVIRDFSVSTGNIYTPGQQPITLAEATDWAIGVGDGTNVVIVAFRTQSLSGGGLGAALASVVNGLGASLVAVEDTGTNLTAVNVEAAFAEILDTGYAWRDQIFATATELTIAAGVIVCTQAYHDIDTEADVASDNLDTINGVADGELVILRAENAARSVVLRDSSVGAGNIYTQSQQSITLAEATDWAIGVGDGTNVVIVAFRSQAKMAGEYVVAATQAVVGVAAIATTAEVTTGADDTKMVSALALNGSSPAIVATNITGIAAGGIDPDATAHAASDGSSHTFLDQSVISGAAPIFAVTNMTGSAAGLDSSATAHAASDGSSHTFLDQSVINGAAPIFAVTNMTGSAAGLDSSATAHAAANGSSHTFIDQSVISGAAPIFAVTNMTGSAAGLDSSATAHAASDGSSHTFIDQSVISGAAPILAVTNMTGSAAGLDSSATAHAAADGSSHTFIDQSVISGATPTFTTANLTEDAGTESGTGVVAVESVGARKIVFTLTDTPVVLVDEAGVVAYGGLQIYAFPQGLISYLGASMDLVLTLSAAGVNADWDGDVSLGSATAANDGTLTGTEVTYIPSTATPQAVASSTTAKAVATTAQLAILDGTAAAAAVYLNLLVDDVDHDVTTTPTNILCNGTITLSFAFLGDT